MDIEPQLGEACTITVIGRSKLSSMENMFLFHDVVGRGALDLPSLETVFDVRSISRALNLAFGVCWRVIAANQILEPRAV